MIDEWNELYPNVDVLQELRKNEKGWSNVNPAKRKTKKEFKDLLIYGSQESRTNPRKIEQQTTKTWHQIRFQ